MFGNKFHFLSVLRWIIADDNRAMETYFCDKSLKMASVLSCARAYAIFSYHIGHNNIHGWRLLFRSDEGRIRFHVSHRICLSSFNLINNVSLNYLLQIKTTIKWDDDSAFEAKSASECEYI